MKNFYKKLSFVMVMGISFSSYAAWNGDALLGHRAMVRNKIRS